MPRDLKTMILETVNNTNPADLLPADLDGAARVTVMAGWPFAKSYLARALQPVDNAQLEQFVRNLIQKAGTMAGYKVTIEALSPEPLPPGQLDPRD